MDRRGAGLRIGKQTRFQAACENLTDLAHELGPDAKLPTVLQLRDRLGISIATLNSVLNELEAQRVVRRRHGIGIYVASDIRRQRLCFLCDPSFFRIAGGTPFWGMLLEQVRARTEKEQETFALHFAVDTPPLVDADRASASFTDKPLLAETLADDLRNGRVDGVLGIGLPRSTALWIERLRVPYVAYAGPGTYMFGVDTRAMVRQGVGSLLKEGSQRLAFFAPIAPHRYTEPDTEHFAVPVFQEMLTAAGLMFDPDLVWDNRHLIPAQGGIHTLTHQEQGYQAAMELFGPHTDPMDWPDGIFSTDDRMTQGALIALLRLGIQIGETVRIATHTEVGSAALLGSEDRVIRIEVDPEEILTEMFLALERLMRQEEQAEGMTTINTYLRLPGES